MQDIQGSALPRFLNLFVEPFLFPRSQELRLPLRQVRLHGEIGLGKIERCLVIHGLSGLSRESAHVMEIRGRNIPE